MAGLEKEKQFGQETLLRKEKVRFLINMPRRRVCVCGGREGGSILDLARGRHLLTLRSKHQWAKLKPPEE